MKKFLTNTLKVILTVVLFAVTPITMDKVERAYFKKFIGSFVVPLTVRSGRYCSASHIRHKDKVYLVTNRHCCAVRNSKAFKTMLTTSFNVKHKVLAVSKHHDVCIATSSRIRGLLIDTKYQIGDGVRLIGYPRGMRQTVRRGDIFDISYNIFPWLPNDKNGFLIFYKNLGITSTSYGGNSGSPVVDNLGRVIGLLFAGDRRYPTEGYVVPSEYIIKAIGEIKE